MTDRDTIALNLVLLKVLKERIGKVDKEVRADGQQAMKVGARDIAELPDGTKIGGVTYAKGAAGKPYVADERAFLAWVKANHPHNVETIERVRPAAQQVILGSIADNGQLVNTRTGEVEEVPGIAWSEDGAPHLTVTAEKDAAAQVERAVRSGLLNLPAVLELEP